ncbi:MAG: type II secretion system F family protein [Kiritimatiellae bacterium]|nr:type II secretion system F family protein [Kiritimatiellia bacterium]
MKADLLIAFLCAAVSAAVLAYLFVRVLFGAKSHASAGGQSALRSLLSLVGVAFERRRGTDAELDRTLTRLEKLVVQAGGKFLEGATAAEVFAARFVFPILALAVIVPLGLLLKLSGGAVFILAAFFAAMMYAYPESGLKSAAQERTRRFTRELPGSLDVMRLVSQSGGDLLSAIRSVIEVSAPGPVREELAHAIAQVAIGSSLVDALNGIAARIGTNEANTVFSTLAQSIEMGTSVSENLKAAAQLMRHAARVRAQAHAQKAVVNMSFPLLLLILPGIFIVLFAPLVIQYVNR